MASISGWYRASIKPRTVVVRSTLHYFAEHWVDSQGSSARCLGEECVLCNLYQRRAVACVAVSEPGSHRVWLLKLPANCESVASQLEQLDGDLVGLQLRVAKVSADPGDGLQVEVTGRAVAMAVPCAKYVAAIGRRAYERCAATLADSPSLSIAQ